MQIETGLYFISTLATSPWGERYVSRNVAEDKSLFPKRINVQPEGAPPAKWSVEALDSGRFKLSSASVVSGPEHTAVLDNKLWGILLDEPFAEEWILTVCQACDDGLFAIEQQNRGSGWVLPYNVDDPQVLVPPLIVGPSEPPFYPPTELFKFIAVEDDSAVTNEDL